MSEAANAVEGVVGLLLGGLILFTVGGALASSMAVPALIDFRLWGVVYVLAALVLGVGAVAAALASIFN